MTAIDRDQVLATLETEANKWRLGSGAQFGAIKSCVSLVAALPAIPLDDELETMRKFHGHCDCYELEDGRVSDHATCCDCGKTNPMLATIAELRGALPVLETKKETP